MKSKSAIVKASGSIIVGIISIILAIVCFASDTGDWEKESTYGGDAYTGIQNAGAVTANNVRCVAQIASFGFGSILLTGGLSLVVVGAYALVIRNEGIAEERDSASSGNVARSASANPNPNPPTNPSTSSASTPSAVPSNAIHSPSQPVQEANNIGQAGSVPVHTPVQPSTIESNSGHAQVQ